MNGPQRGIRLASSVLAPLAFLAVHAASADTSREPAFRSEPMPSANELVREVIYNENQAQIQDQSCWRYRALVTEGGRTELRDVFETRDGTVHRLIELNYQPLNAAQRQREEARLGKLFHDPQAIRKATQSRHQDAEQERKLMDMLPDAFVYEYDGYKEDETRLRFEPNPNFHPPNREAQVFHHMEGTMWVDTRQKRLAALEGRLTSEVKFGYGLLGHLNQGGTFHVQQSDKGAGHWEMTALDVEMTGRALFFKTIGVEEKERLFDFTPIPEDMTLQQALSQLEEDDWTPTRPAVAPSKQ